MMITTKIMSTFNKKNTIRYSDAELAEFKDIICHKLSISEAKIQELESSIKEYTEESSMSYGGDIMDVSSRQDEKEVLLNLLDRQKKYKIQLQNALFRIGNKSYGICSVTGEKISKKRLEIVPTTTKSVNAKNEENKEP